MITMNEVVEKEPILKYSGVLTNALELSDVKIDDLDARAGKMENAIKGIRKDVKSTRKDMNYLNHKINDVNDSLEKESLRISEYATEINNLDREICKLAESERKAKADIDVLGNALDKHVEHTKKVIFYLKFIIPASTLVGAGIGLGLSFLLLH